jgi:hypothetical protein
MINLMKNCGDLTHPVVDILTATLNDRLASRRRPTRRAQARIGLS